jgi:hypothetical protein
VDAEKNDCKVWAIEPEQSTRRAKLDDVTAPVAAFDFAPKRLGLAKLLRQFTGLV